MYIYILLIYFSSENGKPFSPYSSAPGQYRGYGTLSYFLLQPISIDIFTCMLFLYMIHIIILYISFLLRNFFYLQI